MSKWQKVPLGNLLQERRERAASDALPVWSVSNQRGFVLPEDIFHKTIASSDTKNYKKVYSEDFAYNPSRINVGSLAFNGSLDAGIVSPMYVVFLIKDKNVLDPQFLFNFLKSSNGRALIEQNTEGGVRFQLRYSRLSSIKIPLPPLAIQRRMSSAIEASIQLQKKRHEANARLDTFTPALFNKMFGDPQTNPMKWPLKHLGDERLADFRYGTSAKCHTEINGLPVLRIPNVLHGDINLLDLKYADLQDAEIQRLVLLSNDILFVRTNGNREYVGRCAVFDLQDQYLFASYLIRARLDVSRLNPWFLTSFLRSEWGRKILSPLIRTTAGQSNISVDGLKRILLPVPPIEVQNHFATIIGQTRLISDKQSSCGSRLDSVFDNLLNGLL